MADPVVLVALVARRPRSSCDPLGAGWSAEAARIARSLAPSADARDDLAHDTLMRAIEHPPADRNMGPWMQRICRNLQVDARRAEARRRQLTPEITAPAGAKNGEETALAHERRREVRRAVLALPREQRRALILRYQSGWSFDRIAARLGLREVTARTRVHRALAALRRRLGELRALGLPGPLAFFKPALAVLIVLAADPRPPMAPARFIPPASSGRAPSPLQPHRPSVARSVAQSVAQSVAIEGAAAASGGPDGDKPAGTRRAEPPCGPQRPAPSAVLKLEFEDDDVPGEVEHPREDGPIIVVKDAVHPSLIELRTQFLPELVKTLEDL